MVCIRLPIVCSDRISSQENSLIYCVCHSAVAFNMAIYRAIYRAVLDTVQCVWGEHISGGCGR